MHHCSYTQEQHTGGPSVPMWIATEPAWGLGAYKHLLCGHQACLPGRFGVGFFSNLRIPCPDSLMDARAGTLGVCDFGPPRSLVAHLRNWDFSGGLILGGKTLSVGPVVGCTCSSHSHSWWVPWTQRCVAPGCPWPWAPKDVWYPNVYPYQLPPGVMCWFLLSTGEVWCILQGAGELPSRWQTESWGQPSGVGPGRPQDLSLSNAPLGPGTWQTLWFSVCVAKATHQMYVSGCL